MNAPIWLGGVSPCTPEEIAENARERARFQIEIDKAFAAAEAAGGVPIDPRVKALKMTTQDVAMTDERLEEIRGQAAALTYAPTKRAADDLLREIDRLRAIVASTSGMERTADLAWENLANAARTWSMQYMDQFDKFKFNSESGMIYVSISMQDPYPDSFEEIT